MKVISKYSGPSIEVYDQRLIRNYLFPVENCSRLHKKFRKQLVAPASKETNQGMVAPSQHVLTPDEVIPTDSKGVFGKSVLYCCWMFYLVTFKKAVIVFLQMQTIFYPLIHFNLGAQLLMGYASTPEQFRLILFLLQKYITVEPQYIKRAQCVEMK